MLGHVALHINEPCGKPARFGKNWITLGLASVLCGRVFLHTRPNLYVFPAGQRTILINLI